jgi:hypothetical protein
VIWVTLRCYGSGAQTTSRAVPAVAAAEAVPARIDFFRIARWHVEHI